MSNQPAKARPPLPTMKKGSGTRRAVGAGRTQTPNPLSALGMSDSKVGHSATLKAVGVPRRKSGAVPVAKATVPRPRERQETLPTPEALEFELLEELRKESHSVPVADDGPIIEIAGDEPHRAPARSAPALEVLAKAAPVLEIEGIDLDTPDATAAPDDDDDDLPGVLNPARISTVAEKERALEEANDPPPRAVARSGPDEPPRSSREYCPLEPSVIVTDEASRGETQQRPVAHLVARDEMPTQPPDDWALPQYEDDLAGESGGDWVGQAWEAERERQAPTVRPACVTKQNRREPRWWLAAVVLLLAGAAAGYLRFPGEYTHAFEVASHHAKTWGGVVQQKLAR